jgi:prepilin peptidase CpaA
MPVLMMFAGGLVLLAAFWDLHSRRIPNLLSILIAVLYFAQSIYASAWSEIPWHLLTGIGVLVVGIFVFSLGWLGGGDVKLLASLALWAGPDYLLMLLLVTGIAGGAVAIAYILPAILGLSPAISRSVDWIFTRMLKLPAPMLMASKSQGLQLPYGVAIAIAGFTVFYQSAGGF